MSCHHLQGLVPTPARTEGCEECLKQGTPWVHLRLCLSCGHVGCCDDSPGRHATRHFHQSHHPVMASFEPGDQWACASSMRSSCLCRSSSYPICDRRLSEFGLPEFCARINHLDGRP